MKVSLSMRKFFALIGLFYLLNTNTWSQGIYAPLNSDYYHLIDRADILGKDFSKSVHTSFKPYRAIDIVSSIDSAHFLNSAQDQFNNSYIKTDHWEYGDENRVASKKPFFEEFLSFASRFTARKQK